MPRDGETARTVRVLARCGSRWALHYILQRTIVLDEIKVGGREILERHAEAARHSLAISHVGVSREREVVVVDVEDRPGVLADLTRKIARAGVNLDLVYVATRNRVVFGSTDLPALRAALDIAG